MTGGIDTCFYCPREIYREGLCQTCYSETDEDEFARPDADEPCDLCMTNLDEQDLCPNCEPGSVYVAVYEVTRNFGGHEEGG